MDPETSKVMQDILAKSMSSLTESDKAFLRARSSYLNASQLETYADVLNDSTAKSIDDMNLKELKAHAAEKGVDITGLTKSADIAAAIAAHDAQ